jgi:hypothetical protein
MAQIPSTEAVAVTFNTATVGAGIKVESIARAINEKLAGRTYLGHVAIRRQELGDQLKGPDGLILLLAPDSEQSTDYISQ